MVSGQVLLHSLTIVDGWRVQDLLLAMRRNPDILTTLPPEATGLMQKLGAAGVSAEGQFLPETYRFPSGTRRRRTAAPGARGVERVLDAAWAAENLHCRCKVPRNC